MSENIIELSAAQLAQKLQAGELTSVQAVARLTRVLEPLIALCPKGRRNSI